MHCDLATHQFGQFAAEVEPQAGTFVALLPVTIHLRERLKQFGLILYPNTDSSVRHAKLRHYPSTLGAPSDMHGHPALFRKLARVSDEVEKDLAQGAAVGADGKIPRSDICF